MGKYVWVLCGATLAASIYLVMKQPLGPTAPVDGSDETIGKLFGWGAKQRVAGTGGQLKGKVEQGAGDLLGNEKLSNEGVFDQIAGTVQDAAGKAANAVADTVRKLT